MIRRSLALFAGIGLAFLMLEMLIRLSGTYQKQSSPAAVRGSFTIICLGNSFTAGLGAPPGMGYCEQMQNQLDTDASLGGRKIRIVNLGRSSMNTREILERLPEFIKQYSPRIALVMTGEPNFWNRAGYGNYLESIGIKSHSWLREASQKIALFRFFHLMKAEREKNSVKFPFIPLNESKTLGFSWFGFLYPGEGELHFLELSPQERNEALYALEKLIHLPEAASIKGEIATTVARIYFYSRNWDMAREWYERTFAIKPFLPDLYFDIKKNLRYFRPEDLSVYRSLLARSKTPAPTLLQKLETSNNYYALTKAVKPLNPLRDRAEFQEWLEALAIKPADTILFQVLYHKLKNSNQTKEAMDLLLRYLPSNPLSTPPLFGLLNKNRNEANFSTERERINRAVNWLQVEFPSRAHEFTTDPDPRIAGWIEADMRAMAQELRSHDIEFIFQNYPPLRTGKQRPENLIINALCEREKFPWTDIERYFREMPDLSHLYSDEFGNLDNHLNAEGYKRLASKLIIEMKKKSLLNFKEKALSP